MSAQPRGFLARLESWYLHAPLRYLLCALAGSLVWPILVTLAASVLRVEREVQPALAGAPPAEFALRALLVAPLLENTLLWAVFRAALFSAQQWLSSQRAGAGAVGLSVVAFALAHWTHKMMFGAEMLAIAWFMTMCFHWGQRHAQPWRGYALALAIHFGVNAVASALRLAHL